MIGFVRGRPPPRNEPLLALRQEARAKLTVRGYTDPRGPVLKEALAALAHGAPFDDFARLAGTILGVRAALYSPSAEVRGNSSLGICLSRAIRGRIAAVGSPYTFLGRPMRAGLLDSSQARQLGEDLWPAITAAPAYPFVQHLLPSVAALKSMDMRTVEGITDAQRVGLGKELPGVIWMAAGAMQPPPIEQPLLAVQFTDDREEAPSTYSWWTDGRLARRLYDSRSEVELVAAARQAAIRDSPVDPPSHECLPEALSLQVSSARQMLVDDETDELAMEFLLGPLGLLKTDPQHAADSVRPLSDAEVNAIKARLEALNALPEHELFSEAGRFLRPGNGSSDDGGYAGELQGDLREHLDKLFSSAAKRTEPITLVVCKDWLGSGKA